MKKMTLSALVHLTSKIIVKRINVQFFIFILSLCCITLSGFAQQSDYQKVLKTTTFRNLGPYRAGSWISAIAVPETTDPAYKYTFYVAGRNGGVWKTVNNGTTFSPIFDKVGVSSIGCISISKSNPNIIWVGTGEAYNARSSHPGKGVYKSINGGKTWAFMGLAETSHIPKVIINPTNPDIVYVAAMGNLYSPNKDRGVFKTADGGKSWKKILYVDENTGVTDLVMHPTNPNILYAASYEKYRLPWTFVAAGEGSRLYKSVNGGDSWEMLKNGLPQGKLGRIGICIYPKNPSILYTVIENMNPKPNIKINEKIAVNYDRDPYYDQFLGGQVYKSANDGKSWELRNDTTSNVSGKAAYSFNQIWVSSENPDNLYIISDDFQVSTDGGKTWPGTNSNKQPLFKNMFGDHRTMWIDPKDARHMLCGSDGGFYETWDGGVNMTFHYQIPLGEMYTVEYDDAKPYNIYVGMQDHDGWKGPVNGWSGEISLEDWVLTGMWDGMYTCIDHNDNRWLYITTQFGGHRRVDQLKGVRVDIEPKAPKGSPKYRFCWTPPLHISPFNSSVIYTGGQKLLRSEDRGDHWQEISPDLTTNDSTKTLGRGHTMFCTLTTISESPVKKGVIWIGTDDGRVQMTKDNGVTWINCTEKIAAVGGPNDAYVERVFASTFKDGTAYICKSGYRSDNPSPMVFMTTDFGNTWKNISAGLPQQSVNVVIEDPKRPGLLYLGNNQGAYVSFDSGDHWIAFDGNIPTVPVKDIKVQSRENDLIIGTYGRGAFVGDISLLQQITNEQINKPVTLFTIKPKPQRNFSERASWGNYRMMGNNNLHTPNEPNGLCIYYHFNQDLATVATIELIDGSGKVLKKAVAGKEAGFHKLMIDTRAITPGSYKVKLSTDNFTAEQPAEVTESPVWPVGYGDWHLR